jgi:hypothetical protein
MPDSIGWLSRRFLPTNRNNGYNVLSHQDFFPIPEKGVTA